MTEAEIAKAIPRRTVRNLDAPPSVRKEMLHMNEDHQEVHDGWKFPSNRYTPGPLYCSSKYPDLMATNTRDEI